MPATLLQRHNELSLRERVVSNLKRLSEALHRQAHEARIIRQESEKDGNDLTNLETNSPEFAAATPSEITGYYVVALAIVAIYILDILLFGGVANSLANIAFPGNESMLIVAKMAVPFVIITLEFFLAFLIYSRSQENTRALANGAKRLNPYWIFGAILTLVMPALAIASHPDTVRLIHSGDSLGTLLLFKLVGLGLLAFAAHALVIFSGERGTKTKAFFYYRIMHRRLQNRLNDHNLNFDRLCLSVVGNWNAYSTEIESYNQRNPDTTIAPLNFDPTTRNFIEECVTGAPASEVEGDGDLSAPHYENGMNGNVQGQPATGDSGHAPFVYSAEGQSQNGSNNGRNSDHEVENRENEFLRSVLTRRIRDAEDEVN
ncbi:MAG: hypothetical protein KF881_01540 [Acidobacteria bacterium]|nr:hypothetical protein [Acidobacteriota bacterium]